MKYMCMVYHDDKTLMDLSHSEHAEIVRECIAWIEELEHTGRHVFSSGLQSARTATTVHTENGKLVITDGPFAETREVLAGFTIIEARDLNDALAIVSRFPAARISKVEVRPLMQPDSVVTDPLDQKLVAVLKDVIGAHA